jgi:DNA-binding GntR family transcriptional regulator
LQINPRRGAQVTSLTIAEVKDLFEVRIALAGLAGRLAAEKHGTDLGVRLKKEVEDLSALAKSGDADSYTNAIYRLYMVLADGGGNSFLRNTLFALAHRTLRYARLGFASAERRIQSARNWKLLAAAVTDLDAGAAQKAAERLVRDSRDSAVKLLQRQQLKDSK